MIRHRRVFKIEVFAPEDYAHKIMNAMAKAGAGRIGNYEHCFSITHVKGFWKPLENSSPYSGTPGKLSEAQEVKIETRCNQEDVGEVHKAILTAHPYEEPVINIIAVEQITLAK